MTPQQAELVDADPIALVQKDATWTFCLLDDCREDPDWCGHDQEAIAKAQIARDLDPSGRPW